MYTPENHAQMFEIIAALRTYASTHSLPQLAEMLDDAFLILAEQGRGAIVRSASSTLRQDSP